MTPRHRDVTCASTSGYMHQYDNRYLWMSLKRIVGSHFANYREAWEANRLIARGQIHPTLSRTYSMDDVGQAALAMGPMGGIPARNCVSECGEVADVVTAATPIVEDRLRWIDQLVAESGCQGAGQRSP